MAEPSRASWYKCLNLIILDCWEKFDETIKTWYKYCQVQEAVEEFLSTEAEWDSFLASLDRKIAGSEGGGESLKAGEPLDLDMNLVEARYCCLLPTLNVKNISPQDWSDHQTFINPGRPRISLGLRSLCAAEALCLTALTGSRSCSGYGGAARILLPFYHRKTGENFRPILDL